MPSPWRPEGDRIPALRRHAFGAMLLLFSSCASAEFGDARTDVFRCRNGSELTVRHQQQAVTVLAGGQSYALDWKSSDVGKRFASRRATLIIDGDFAAFVADDLGDLGGCRSRRSSE